jgi:cytochrome c1
MLKWVALTIMGLALAVASVLGAKLPTTTPSPVPAPPTRSNVHAGDYVGPEACAECHEEKYAQWRQHSHSRMNLDANQDSVLGDFSGVELEYAGERARFDRDGESFFMTLWGDEGRRRYRVTRTVGSRFTQMYVGVQVEGPEPRGNPAYIREGKLPFGYWIARKAWFPEPYFDSDCPPEYGPTGDVSLPAAEAHGTSWRRNCIFCHNTYPYEERLREGNGTTGFPAEDLHLVGDEDDAPGLRPEELVTLGISCESCHFGGREHAEDEKTILFLPTSPKLAFGKATPELVRSARTSAYAVNSICAQCHFSRGVSSYPNGAGTWNSREAVDMLEGSCASQVKCTDCHDPHVASAPGGGPDRPEHIQACLECHEGYRDPEAREDHTQHGVEVSCLDCHMPRIVQGLESVVRTHRISAPGDPRMLAAGAPNACNLCHLDRSIEWTAAALRLGWGRRVPVNPTWSKAYGGRTDAATGLAWLSSSVASHRLVAADAYARSPQGKTELGRLIRSLDDPMAVNRMFGLFAVERVLGRRLTEVEYSPTAPPETRRQQVAELLQAH